jgi:hypothetical protein
MSRSFLSRLAIAAVFGLAAATAASPVLAADYTKEQLAAARAAIEASHVADGVDNLLLGVAQQTKSNLIRTAPSFSNQIEAATNKVAIELAGERVDLDHAIQQLWASKFTTQELQDIAKFYSSPLGQKLAKETNGLLASASQDLQIYQQKLAQDMYQKTREELKKQGLPF